MNQNALNLQSTKTRVIFWIGMLILPVFWIWWMRERYFSKTERIIGWVWTAFYVGAGIYWHEYVETSAEGGALGYHFVALRISIVLSLWLMFRILGMYQTVLILIVSIDVIAILTATTVPEMMRSDPTPRALILPSILIVAHLLLDPVRNRLKASRIIQWILTH